MDKLSVREYEDLASSTHAFYGAAKATKANRLEHSESQRLETLAGSIGLFDLVKIARLTGDYTFSIILKAHCTAIGYKDRRRQYGSLELFY